MNKEKIKKFVSDHEDEIISWTLAGVTGLIAAGSYFIGYKKCQIDIKKYVTKSPSLSQIVPMLADASSHKNGCQWFINNRDKFSASDLGKLGEVMVETNSDGFNLDDYTNVILFKKL